MEVVDVERPTGQGIRVRVVSSGICGTDVANARLGPMAVTLGHEFAGYTDNERLVAVEPIVTCGCCTECLRGSYHLCQGSAHGWIGGTVDGGMAEEVVVPERAVVDSHFGGSLRCQSGRAPCRCAPRAPAGWKEFQGGGWPS